MVQSFLRIIQSTYFDDDILVRSGGMVTGAEATRENDLTNGRAKKCFFSVNRGHPLTTQVETVRTFLPWRTSSGRRFSSVVDNFRIQSSKVEGINRSLESPAARRKIHLELARPKRWLVAGQRTVFLRIIYKTENPYTNGQNQCRQNRSHSR